MNTRLPMLAALIAALALYVSVIAALLILAVLGLVARATAGGAAARLAPAAASPAARRNTTLFVVLLLTAAVLGFGGRERTRLDRARSFTGIPVEDVTGAELRLTEDSRLISSGATLYVGRLTEVRRDAELQAGAGGSAVAFLRGGPRAVRGERLRLSGSLVQAEPDSSAAYLLWARGEAEVWGQQRIRRALLGRMAEAATALPEQTQALFSAIFLGQQDDLSDRERAAFRNSGSLHALALSGLHLGILALLVGRLASRLLGRIQAVWLVVPVLVVYVWMVGPRPSLMRALLLAVFGALFMLRDRRVGIGNLLAYVFLVMIAVQPASAATLSFQLSFSALAGIVLLSPRIERLLSGRVPRVVSVPLSAALGAQAATTPILAESIGTLHFIGIPASLMVVPLVTLFLYLGLAVAGLGIAGHGLAGLGVAGLGPAGVGVQSIAAAGLSLAHRVLIGFAEFAGRAPSLDTPNGMEAGHWFALTLFLLLVYYRELRWLLAGLRRSRGGRLAAHTYNPEAA
ncbi:MAG: ComEC/Rec2 family competence protein [Spirochaetaceae bacterium]|nr:MAG: ComEC/Rec2 family competence protein [Spirochaetaceae bacterium]